MELIHYGLLLKVDDDNREFDDFLYFQTLLLVASTFEVNHEQVFKL